MNTAAALPVASTILAQLGGSRFLAMTGARDLVGSANSLRLRLPRGLAKSAISHVTVTLDAGTDTYTVAAIRYVPRTLTSHPVAAQDMVHADSLQRVFQSITGLDTRL